MVPTFSPAEKATLLAVKGVGPTVVKRLEEMGFHSLAALAQADARTLVEMGAGLTGSSCWKNSPQARAAVQGAIDAALAERPNPNNNRPS
jgi:predicted RecB family nuclease